MDFTDFHLLRPWWLLALIPLVGVLWLVSQRKLGARAWDAVIDPQLRPYVLIGKTSRKAIWPVMVIGLGGLLGIIALAGPTWDRLPQPVFRQQSALVIALDLSRSMDTTDIQPSRLARARYKIADILKQRKEGQTALLVYAGQAYAVSPLTTDAETIASQLPALTTDLMPSQGSRSDLAMLKASELLEQAGLSHGEILLVTDGVHFDRAEKAARQLRDAGYNLSVLGIGTPEGAPIPLRSGGFVKDAAGSIVVSELNIDSLRGLARAGNGLYRGLSVGDEDIKALLAPLNDNRLQNEFEQTILKTDLWREAGPWFLLLLLPLAALAFRRGYLSVIVVLLAPLPQPSHALDWAELWLRSDQQASQALQQGDASRAAELFKRPDWKGAAHYRAGEYEQAVQSLDGLDSAQTLYNKGNALARLGRYPEAIEAYEEAIQLDPAHEDARYNRDLVERQLQEQQQQAGQQGQEGQPQQGQQNQSPQQAGQDQGMEQQSQGGVENETDSQDQDNPDDAAASAQSPNKKRMPESMKSPADTHNRTTDAEQPTELEQQDPNDASTAQSPAQDQVTDESQQATEQWLRRIPDDPGGLLRRKFYYQYQRQPQASRDEAQPW